MSIRSTSMSPMHRATLLCGFLSLSACATTDIVAGFDRSPPPDLGRPGWVRTAAGVGGWIGGAVGGVVSIVLLPVTYPLSLAASDGIGETTSTELILFPVSVGAGIGHALFGAPTDSIDYVFRRAWVEEDRPANTYELVPMDPPGAATHGVEVEARK